VHLSALVESADHVCCRYRVAAFRPFLEGAGHTLELLPLPRGWWGRLRLFRRLRGRAVLLQRRLLPWWQLALLRRAAALLLFDYDDAVFLRDSYAPKGQRHAGRLRRFAATVRACDAVVAGNGFLADQAARFVAADRVHVIPTCVDPALYPPPAPRRAGPGLELVWVGSSSTLQGLERVRPLLEELGRRVPGLRLKLVCDRFLTLDNMPVVEVPWTADGEAAALASADVGVSWVPDDDWSRGKCGLKVLQYMAAGLPVVCNPVGVHAEMVRSGTTGYLAATPGEWLAAVATLAAEPWLRRRLGEAGRRRLEADYSVAAGARRWLALLERLQRRTARSA
jgi:glycosyltransferase involved in cell wall biosynthesis